MHAQSCFGDYYRALSEPLTMSSMVGRVVVKNREEIRGSRCGRFEVLSRNFRSVTQ
jgi:hypothetical protein